MPSKILSISISQEDYDYLQEDGFLSPSKIFQTALNNIKESREGLAEQVKRLTVANSVLQRKLLEAQDARPV